MKIEKYEDKEINVLAWIAIVDSEREREAALNEFKSTLQEFEGLRGEAEYLTDEEPYKNALLARSLGSKGYLLLLDSSNDKLEEILNDLRQTYAEFVEAGKVPSRERARQMLIKEGHKPLYGDDEVDVEFEQNVETREMGITKSAVERDCKYLKLGVTV